MKANRTIQIVIEPSESLQATLLTFSSLCNTLSSVAWNEGRPLQALALHKGVYHSIKGRLSSQLTCTAIRLTAAAYVSANSNEHKIAKPFKFKKSFALFLIGTRGRDAAFRKNGTLSIWTVEGRKHLSYTIPDYFKPIFATAISIDSITVKIRNDKLIGYVCITIDLPEAQGIIPVGTDLNETNALVAVNADNKELFISGLNRKVRNIKTRKTINRLQSKLASCKAKHKSTKSVAGVLKRLQGKQTHRTREFCHAASKQLVAFAGQNAVLIFEDLRFGQGKRGRPSWNRRFHSWPRAMLLAFTTYKMQGKGQIALVNPKHTSQICSRCGLFGIRHRHQFSCPHCGVKLHADLNAAVNIRNRYTISRDSGVLATTLEASSGGKLTAKAASS